MNYQICFGAYCTIFREKSLVTCSKLSAYFKVVTLVTAHKINIIVYEFLILVIAVQKSMEWKSSR
jgi:hypothetical protein